MSETVRLYAFDTGLVAAFFALVCASSWGLLLLFDRVGGSLGGIVSRKTEKLASLEGLRGVLAASVVAHHAYCWFYYLRGGVWAPGSSVVFARLASFGVVQFFFLSGFLFWRKLIKSGRIPLGSFYLSRFVRIGPAYYTCVGLGLLVGLAGGGMQLKESPAALAGHLLRWMLFALAGRPAVNGIDLLRVTSGVTWTLALEWMFYLSLPLLAWFARKSGRVWLLAPLFGILYAVGIPLRSPGDANLDLLWFAGLLSEFGRYMMIGFGAGIVVATYEQRIRGWARGLARWQNPIMLASFLIYLYTPWLLSSMVRVAIGIFLVPGFALVVHGADLFGFLTSRVVRLLGVVSYPMYLVHGVVYYAAMLLRGGMHPVAGPVYIAQTAGCVVCVVLLSTAVHILVERPTMKLSEKIARKAALPQAGLLEPAPQEAAGS